jgi:hypothetical protein
LKDNFQLLGNWATTKRALDDTMTVKYVATLITSIFIGIAWDWWKWFPTKTKEEIVYSLFVDYNLIEALRSKLFGSKVGVESEHLDSLFDVFGHYIIFHLSRCFMGEKIRGINLQNHFSS